MDEIRAGRGPLERAGAGQDGPKIGTPRRSSAFGKNDARPRTPGRIDAWDTEGAILGTCINEPRVSEPAALPLQLTRPM